MDIDLTYLVQLGLFLTILVTLNGILIKPMLRVIIEREEKTVGARDDVDRLQREGSSDQETYQRRMQEAARAAQRARDHLKEQGRDQERKLLSELRAEIADTLNNTRAQVGKEEARARAELSGDADAMSRELVRKILGREVAA